MSGHEARPEHPRPPTDMPERYGRNVAASYANTLVAALVALAVTPVLARGLGPEQYGIWVLVASFALYLELLEFGFGGATVKYVAEAWGKRDRQELATAIATSFWILVASGLGALALAGILAATFPALFDVSGPVAHDAQILILLVLFELAVSIPLDTFGGVLMGLQRLDLVYGTLMAVAVAQAVAWTIIILLGGGLVELGIATVVLGLAGQLWRLALARREVGGTFVSRRWFRRERVLEMGGYSIWMSLGEVSTIVIMRLDIVVVGAILGVHAAGVYAVAQRLTRIGVQMIQPVTTAFLPHASSLAARKETEALRSSWLAGTRLSLGVALPVCLALMLLADPAVRAWVGDEFADASSVVVFLAAAAAVAGLSDTSNLVMQGVGNPRLPAISKLIEAVLNLSLSIALGLWIGMEGVAIATLVGTVAGQLVFFLPRACRALGVPLRSLVATLVRAQAAPVLASVVVGVAWNEAGVSGVGLVLAAGASMVLAYGLVFWHTGMSATERALLAARVRRLLRRGREATA